MKRADGIHDQPTTSKNSYRNRSEIFGPHDDGPLHELTGHSQKWFPNAAAQCFRPHRKLLPWRQRLAAGAGSSFGMEHRGRDQKSRNESVRQALETLRPSLAGSKAAPD